MNPKAFRGFDEPKRDTYENLKQEYDCVKEDIKAISQMEISDEAKKLPIEELNKQIAEIKERMHNYIDTL